MKKAIGSITLSLLLFVSPVLNVNTNVVDNDTLISPLNNEEPGEFIVD